MLDGNDTLTMTMERPEPAGLDIDTDDDALLKRIAAGDSTAFAALMRRHVDRAHGLAYRIVGNRSDAEDVVQDAFLKVWTRAGQWRPGTAQFSTWLYRVVFNRCLDLKRRPRSDNLEAMDEIGDGRPDALSGIEAQQDQRRMAAAIAGLPDRQRAAIALTYTTGLANAAAAEVMEISLKAFESLLVRAKKELRRDLSRSGEEWMQ
jgi:RNA polymerase sigma-70 factor, ECF subfamily